MVYREFARCYVKGPWTYYSRDMVEKLPAVLECFGHEPRAILDIACGEGTFAVAVASSGRYVVGLDSSPQMLEYARERAATHDSRVDFVLGDMRYIPFSDGFDLVTCWFDSLNYLLHLADLERTFVGVSQCLRTGGLFVFDMNTIYGLQVGWLQQPFYVQADDEEMFEVGFPTYDRSTRAATLEIRGFVKNSEGNWVRVSEHHEEMGYTLKAIRACLRKAGLTELASWGSLEDMSKVTRTSQRVWFVARK